MTVSEICVLLVTLYIIVLCSWVSSFGGVVGEEWWGRSGGGGVVGEGATLFYLIFIYYS